MFDRKVTHINFSSLGLLFGLLILQLARTSSADPEETSHKGAATSDDLSESSEDPVDEIRYRFGLGKRLPDQQQRFSFGLGKRDPREQRFNFGLGKRGPGEQRFNFGLGKRGVGEQRFSFGLGKRGPGEQRFSFGLGKRATEQRFNFGLGKREFAHQPQPWNDDDLDATEHEMADAGVKRRYDFGLGKRAEIEKRNLPPAELEEYMKRRYSFGLGK